MNKKKKFSKGSLIEVVTPFDDKADEMGLYDDCPLCRDLREKIKTGEVEVWDPEKESATEH